MNQKLVDLIDEIKTKKALVASLAADDKLEEAKTEKQNLINLQDKFDLLKETMEEEPEKMADKIQVQTEDKKDAVKEFANAARRGFKNVSNNEGTPADGGYTVPADIQTQINKLKEADFALSDLFSSESVATNSGRRVYQTRAAATGFSKVGEGAAIGQAGRPQFTKIDYAIEKYAGWLPVTNELLKDSDANITSVLTDWLAKEDKATRNALCVAAIAEKDGVAFTGIDDIKNAINVTLGSAYAGAIQIVTNDDGLQYLDTLKDADGRYLLSANANGAAPMQKVLAVGATNIPVVVVPNAILPNGGTSKNQMPFVVGDFKEYAKIFDREQLSIKMSDEAAVTGFNAFEDDMTLLRAIIRLDVEVIDAAAIVNGYVVKS